MWTHGTHSTEMQVQGNGLSAMWQTWSHHSTLPREEQQQAVMEQTPATIGSTPAVKDTRLGGRKRHNALQHFCLIARAKALIVEPTINGTPIRMELDTGSALSIIPDCVFCHHLSRLPLSPTSVVLKTYSVERIKPLGVISVDVESNGQHHDVKALIVKTDRPPLFGRDWLQYIRIDWSHVHCLASSTASTQHRRDELLERHSAVFGDDRGRFRHCKGRLHLVDGAKPRFFKARPLPYTLRDKVATELDRLENDGILTKVD